MKPTTLMTKPQPVEVLFVRLLPEDLVDNHIYGEYASPALASERVQTRDEPSQRIRFHEGSLATHEQ